MGSLNNLVVALVGLLVVVVVAVVGLRLSLERSVAVAPPKVTVEGGMIHGQVESAAELARMLEQHHDRLQ